MRVKKVKAKRETNLQKFTIPLLCVSIGILVTFSFNKFLVHAADSTINACVNKHGLLRVLSAGDTCNNSETPLDLGSSSPTNIVSNTVTLPAGYKCNSTYVTEDNGSQFCLVDSISMASEPVSTGNMEQTPDGRWWQDSTLIGGNEFRTTWSNGKLELLRYNNPDEAGFPRSATIRYFGIPKN